MSALEAPRAAARTPLRASLSPLEWFGLPEAFCALFHLEPGEGRILAQLVNFAPAPLPAWRFEKPSRRRSASDVENANPGASVRVRIVHLRRKLVIYGDEIVSLRAALRDVGEPFTIRSQRPLGGYWISEIDAERLIALARAWASAR